jgi:uncharacterized damage-inducible protein DinB
MVSPDGPALGRTFLQESRERLAEDFLPRIERCVGQLSDDQLWWRPNEASNSIGNLMLHLSGNVRQWIVSGIGGATDVRRRQQEFDERGPLPRAEILQRLRDTVAEAARVLADFDPAGLLESRKIQGHEVTVLQAIYHVVEHFSMHTGQIILLTKAQTGRDAGFYTATPDGVAKAAWKKTP